MEPEPRTPVSFSATTPPAASADRSSTPAEQREFVEEIIRQEERVTALNVEQLNEMDVSYLVRKESNDRVVLVADETKERRGVTKAASKVLVHLYGQATPEASRSRSPMKSNSSGATAATSNRMERNHQNNGGSDRVTNSAAAAVEPPIKNKPHPNSNHTNNNNNKKNNNSISGDTGAAGWKSSRVHHPPPRPPSFNSMDMDSPRGHHYHSQHWSMDEGQEWASEDEQQETSTTLPSPESEGANVAHQDHHHDGRRPEQRLESLVGYFLFGVLLGLFTA